MNLPIPTRSQNALGKHVSLFPDGTRMRIKVRSLDARCDFEARGGSEISRRRNERGRGFSAVLVDEKAADCTRLYGRGCGREKYETGRVWRNEQENTRTIDENAVVLKPNRKC